MNNKKLQWTRPEVVRLNNGKVQSGTSPVDCPEFNYYSYCIGGNCVQTNVVYSSACDGSSLFAGTCTPGTGSAACS